MPRVRIRTSNGECIVGGQNYSDLTISLKTQAARNTAELRAEARIMAGKIMIERATWRFPELPETSTVELISESDRSAHAQYDPPDEIVIGHLSKDAGAATTQGAEFDIGRAQKELLDLSARLASITPEPVGRTAKRAFHRCAFCGRHETEVEKLVAGDEAAICGSCILAATNLLAGEGP